MEVFRTNADRTGCTLDRMGVRVFSRQGLAARRHDVRSDVRAGDVRHRSLLGTNKQLY